MRIVTDSRQSRAQYISIQHATKQDAAVAACYYCPMVRVANLSLFSYKRTKTIKKITICIYISEHPFPMHYGYERQQNKNTTTIKRRRTKKRTTSIKVRLFIGRDAKSLTVVSVVVESIPRAVVEQHPPPPSGMLAVCGACALRVDGARVVVTLLELHHHALPESRPAFPEKPRLDRTPCSRYRQ